MKSRIAFICLSSALIISYLLFRSNYKALAKIENKPIQEPINTIQYIEVKSDLLEYEDLGYFEVTAYCSCKKCCGKTDGITRSEQKAIEGITCGTDIAVIPLNSKIVIEGYGLRICQDTGNFKGKKIDLYINNHQRAKEFETKKLRIWRVKN